MPTAHNDPSRRVAVSFIVWIRVLLSSLYDVERERHRARLVRRRYRLMLQQSRVFFALLWLVLRLDFQQQVDRLIGQLVVLVCDALLLALDHFCDRARVPVLWHLLVVAGNDLFFIAASLCLLVHPFFVRGQQPRVNGLPRVFGLSSTPRAQVLATVIRLPDWHLEQLENIDIIRILDRPVDAELREAG